MKKIVSIFLIFALTVTFIGTFSVPVNASVPTADDMGGYENLCLTYTFRTSNYDNGRHYVDDLMPYVAYLDKNGNIKDFFFDSYLFLPCMDFGPSGARMHVDVNNPTKAIDWTTYVEDTFAPGANVDALEQAYGNAKIALNDNESKAGVFFTILYPCAAARDFGVLGGRQLNFSIKEDRKYAIKWIIDEQIKLFNDGNYQNLDLVGFYWLEEYLPFQGDVEIFQYASEYLHSLGLKFIWIPWYTASGYDRWAELGFDAVCMQPNMYWMGYADPNRVLNSTEISNNFGMGMEIEVDYRVTEDEFFNRYLTYLEGGMTSGMMNGVKMYYQDGKPAVYYQACYSNNQRYRTVYDLTYKYAKGTLTQEDIDANRPEGMKVEFVDDINFNGIRHSGVRWFSLNKSYAGCPSYVDGSGLEYQNVDGKELTDGIIATSHLSTDWHAFHSSILDGEGRMSVTIDLGEIRTDITNFAAHFDNTQESGIGTPTDIKILISKNGSKFYEVASPSQTFDPRSSCINYEHDKAVSARYVKLSFLPGDKNFVFCSEFLVGTKPKVSADEDNNDGNTEETISNATTSEESVSNSVTMNVEDSHKNNNIGLIIGISVGALLLAGITVGSIIIIKKRRK